MLGLAPISTTNKSDVIAEQLIDFINLNKYEAGDQLPSERELMEALGVGRSSVREAVRKLEAKNIIQIKRGAGTFLCRQVSKDEVLVPINIKPDRDSLIFALDIRRGLESEAAMIAASRGTDEAIAYIEECLVAMEHAHQIHGSAREEDAVFHRSIYLATGNPLFEQLISGMRGPFQSFFSKPYDRQDFGQRSFPLHRELYEAIAKRDPELSRITTLKLLDCVERDILEMAPA
ncbi:FadR/GntR family transcriptional regulator [Kiloniella majae]|uniref:FadR/GntR family transcriptional regulator n=1 Tax=Kiloniella majae TaxID=1938558 RepID=UPI000A277D86|nr:FadR/GntR family transcriptional regulator [Kiloniella majae]